MTLDEKALATMRAPGYDHSSHADGYLTGPVVEALKAEFPGTVAKAIMEGADDPAELSDRAVLYLVMTSGSLYLPEDWAAMVERINTAARLDADRRKATARKTRGRANRPRERIDPIPGTRVIPYDHLPRRIKAGRSKSLRKAAERRKRRRQDIEPIMVQPSARRLRLMTKDDIRQYAADLERIAGRIDAAFLADLSDEGPCPYHIYRYGRAR